MKKTWLLLNICIIFAIVAVIALTIGVKSLGNGKMPSDSPEAQTEPSAETSIEVQQKTIEKSLVLDTMIHNYFVENDVSSDEVAIYYENLETNEAYELNADEYFISASIYKVPLAMLYYEKLNAKEITLDTKLKYTAISYEAGGLIGETYSIGDYITLETLLYNSIVLSDNTASRILFNNLGGWDTYRTMIKKYDEVNSDSTEFYDNAFTSRYTNSVLKYLYEHEKEYDYLLFDMKLVCQDSYLKANIPKEKEVAQKYGSYDNSENAIGIVYGDTPYLISIFTNPSTGGGEKIVGDLSEIFYKYTYS